MPPTLYSICWVAFLDFFFFIDQDPFHSLKIQEDESMKVNEKKQNPPSPMHIWFMTSLSHLCCSTTRVRKQKLNC